MRPHGIPLKFISTKPNHCALKILRPSTIVNIYIYIYIYILPFWLGMNIIDLINWKKKEKWKGKSLTKLVEFASIASSSVFTRGILSHNFIKEVMRIETITKKRTEMKSLIKEKLLRDWFEWRKVPAYCLGPAKSDLHTWHN